MSEHQTWIVDHGEYQSHIFYTDVTTDPNDDDTEHPTEWAIFRISDGQQLATGWGTSRNHAEASVAAKLKVLRSG